MGKEALVVCGEQRKAGITVWDLETGDVLLRILTSGSQPHGLLCLQNRVLVASQLQKDRPFGCGSIFFWHLNKIQAARVSYPMEAIGPIASTRDGVYLVGGAPSGNAYIWEVTSGRLLKKWHAHHKPLCCLTFSHDDSFVVSGAEDGTMCVWLLISLLHTEDPQCGGSVPSLQNWSEHCSSITGFVSVSGGFGPALLSSSLDGRCMVWDLVSGRLLQNHVFSDAITAIAIDPGEQLLFAGREDGKIYVNALDLGLQENQITISEDESGVLFGHEGPITALAFSSGGSFLISASEDCTACLWDVQSWQLIRRFTHEKGHITNLIVIPKSSLLATKENQGLHLQPKFSKLEKTCQLSNAQTGIVTLLSGYNFHEGHPSATYSLSSSLLNKQILDTEHGRTPEMIQVKIGTSIENRLWIFNMTKHINSINQHLQSRVIDMVHHRLVSDDAMIVRRRRGKAKTGDLQENQESPS
ncbi:uncharacterized protein A4U43_C02F10130 [Asparagus officinalis]|uniref:Uncharacterized protein n=1 Tax=Asparagus officinalis TaxID=4686 RepID=A0A5P1FHF0_ASPOF|nr:protein ROOT INITIATION DEFECTIVE 3-like [Asparagus officinalis]XP_020253419.1 protein ROOT INITIATION DEFECTIVE 3-like [Asparagus officinalis]ONK77748.1 uncharacterized protein A4U43_C02F10130 [Asparagus officinalis]